MASSEGKGQPSLWKRWPEQNEASEVSQEQQALLIPGVGTVRKGVWTAAYARGWGEVLLQRHSASSRCGVKPHLPQKP